MQPCRLLEWDLLAKRLAYLRRVFSAVSVHALVTLFTLTHCWRDKPLYNSNAIFQFNTYDRRILKVYDRIIFTFGDQMRYNILNVWKMPNIHYITLNYLFD